MFHFYCCLSLLIAFSCAQKSAYYLVFASMVSDASFPQPHVAGHDVYVLQPANFTAVLVERLRQKTKPNATLLLYWDAGDVSVLCCVVLLLFVVNRTKVPIAVDGTCSTGHLMGDLKHPPRSCDTPSQPYYHCGISQWQRDIASAVTTSWLAYQICPSNDHPTLLCMYPGLASYVWSQPMAASTSLLLATTVKRLGVDGVYLDQLMTSYVRTHSWTAPMYARYNVSGCGIDVSGDGIPDSLDHAVLQGATWQNVFLSQLRGHLGSRSVILANAGGPYSSDVVNGITVEAEACAQSQQTCIEAFDATKYMQQERLLSILWLKNPQDFPPREQCLFAQSLSKQFPFIAIGVDIFDGESVFCGHNNTM
jgi:hypothetical protein